MMSDLSATVKPLLRLRKTLGLGIHANTEVCISMLRHPSMQWLYGKRPSQLQQLLSTPYT